MRLQQRFELQVHLIVFAIFIAVAVCDISTNCEAEETVVSKMSVFNYALPADGAKPENIGKLNVTSLQKDWFKAPVTKRAGMFNPVFLPFQYYEGVGTYDSKQGLAFPCLLSLKFDFVPDNFSARHPAFIYRKKAVWNVKPGQTDKIAEYIRYWEATHAFGGIITRKPDGYTGQMMVYDRTGKEVFTEKYAEPVPYFTLMGFMVKSWMEYRHQPVSEGLYQELIRPMTTDMQCVNLYGDSFSKEWRTQEEWDLYDEILRRDPNFGEVRWWYANQKSWATDDHTSLRMENGRALQDHLVICALEEFNCQDKSVQDTFLQKLAYAESICGENPSVASVRLKVNGSKLSIEQLDSLLPLAEKYPCCYRLLYRLAMEYAGRGMCEKSIPLYLSAVFSGYMPGTGSFEWEWSRLLESFYKLGYYNEAIFCGWMAIHEGVDEKKYSIYTYLGNAHKEQFHFESAAKIFNKISSDDGGEENTLLCVYESGNLNMLELLNKTKPKFESKTVTARQLTAEGKYAEALLELETKARTFASYGAKSQDLSDKIIAADIYLLMDDVENAKKAAVCAWFISPRSRQVNFLLAKAFEGDRTILGRYVAVESFIFGNQQRESEIAKTVQPLSFSQEDLLSDLAEIRKRYVEARQEPEFWHQFSPFEIEYLCLGLVKSENSKAAKDAIDLYQTYAATMQKYSDYQRIHLRAFLIQLTDLLNAEKNQALIPQNM